MKKLIVILTILTTLRLSAQVCDDVNLTVTTTSSINYSFDTFGKYVAGLTENGASRLKVTVDNSLTNNPNCRWNLVLYVENASATTANTDWEELQSQSTSGSNPRIDMLQVRVRNNCNTSQTGNQFFNVPAITGTPIMIISNTGVTVPAGSCTTNVNGPGNPTTNYNEFTFDIDYRIVPASGMKSGTYQLKLKYLLIEAL